MDKIQLIKQEIEKELTVLDKTSVYDTGRESELNHLLLFINSLPEEPASEDLEEELHNWMRENCDDDGFFNQLELARHFAEWQKAQDEKIVFYENKQSKSWQRIYKKAYDDVKKEMMKDAVEGFVSLCHDYPYRRSLVAIADGLVNFEYAEKVKIIIVKTEQQ